VDSRQGSWEGGEAFKLSRRNSEDMCGDRGRGKGFDWHVVVKVALSRKMVIVQGDSGQQRAWLGRD